ncbi:O-methyltransferase [Paenibacillus sp. P96]|uniref:O-methyltransferase n=1 Tax=Paenibacillus zeirhizosphaerae TaxID=2987519 RepID=A0ABT9FUJ0_9BACL|nr:O-methyltransferase [Paenibacillus sp. P96]MDP4098407.1 O-methyltransferase [Paenibacillus sp. P96]
MIKMEQLSLARQVDMVFRELDDELSGMDSGIVFLQIRNNVIGKFGIRHFPVESRGGQMQMSESGLNAQQRSSFRSMALEALKLKQKWTHGEISYEFTIRQGLINVDTTIESNYNMANLMIRYPRHHTYQEVNTELL